MIRKIISGGQYGADQAGLRVALDLGLKTGGMVPNGWVTKFGPRPQLAKLGLIEHPTNAKYPARTAWNVKHSDATVRLAYNFSTAGEVCTWKAIDKYNKPYFDINLNDVESGENLYIFDFAEFLESNHVEVLNVAGNCGNTKAEAKKVYNIVRHTLGLYIKKYNDSCVLEDEWDLNDL